MNQNELSISLAKRNTKGLSQWSHISNFSGNKEFSADELIEAYEIGKFAGLKITKGSHLDLFCFLIFLSKITIKAI
jgi:hypothetical protein